MVGYELYRGGVLLGRIVHTDEDFPWHLGRFAPGPGFEAVASLFELEATLLSCGGTGWDEGSWRKVREEIDRPGIRLVECESGHALERPLIHIQCQDAWWR